MTGPEFIFMLTRADRTVPDAMDQLGEVLASGLRHIGFKDLGLPLADLHRLAAAIRASGGTLYLEVVSLDAASEAASARAAAGLGVDFLLGAPGPISCCPSCGAAAFVTILSRAALPAIRADWRAASGKS